MKKILFYSVFLWSLSANDALELYKRAQTFEQNGDLQNAIIYYKKAAKISLDINSSENLALNTQVLNANSPVQNSKPNANLLGIEAYKENYLLPLSYKSSRVGDEKNPETKFQISLKKELWSDIFGSGAELDFAYTQISWWQIAQDSAPFRETNYMPEFFVYSNVNSLKFLRGMQIGVLHDSNGRGGKYSRSWNRVYLQGFLDFGALKISPRIWAKIGNTTDNPSIEKYAGNGDISIVYEFGKNVFKLNAANNLRFNENKGNAELSWYFPLSGRIYGYIQLFNGYAESLIDYDKSTSRASFGFLIFK